ncbi:MAG: ATP-binding protein [Oscillospiraceae bacterium]
MRKRITWVLLLTCTVAMAAFAAAVLLWTNHRFVENEKQNQDAYLRTILYTAELPEDFGLFCRELAGQLREGARITVCSVDGTVMGDSVLPAAEMENHSDRPEIAMAMEEGFGQDVRFSDSTGVSTIYTARLWRDGYVLRLALPVPNTAAFVRELLPAIILVYLLLIVVVALAARKLAALAMRPYTRLSGDIAGALEQGKNLDTVSYTDENRSLAENFQTALTEIDRYRTEARREAERIETILSGLEDGVIFLDGEGRIVLCNRAALDYLGLEGLPEERRLALLCRVEGLSRSMEEALASGEHVSADLERDGKTYRAAISPASGGVMVILTDVSGLVRLEQARSSFTANVSHELKTPLTAISGFSELIETGLVSDPAEIRENMRIVSAEAERMTKLVEDILHLSALETEEQPQREETDMRGAFETASSLLAGPIAEKGLSVEVAGDCYAPLSPEHAAELAGNLLSNAVRYNRPGGQVRVALSEEEESAVIAVTDTGIGIPQEHLAHIFERFYRVDKDRSRATGGTGLGLAIVKHIVELYGGEIAAESGEGGSAFTVRLPK